MVEHWWQLCQAGADASEILLIAPTRADADELGALIQARLLNADLLGPAVVTTPTGTLYEGDRVVATKNLWRLDVRNGDKGTIIETANDGGVRSSSTAKAR
jgi:ATP-dependent exoDNAse (exonuclease V) alpha subunit